MEYDLPYPCNAVAANAAALFEQELMKDLRSLTPELHAAVKKCVRECDESGKSFTAEFSKITLKPHWRSSLLPVAHRASLQLRNWMKEIGLDQYSSPASSYCNIDEHGRAFKWVSLAAEQAETGHFFTIPHLPSANLKPVFVPLLGWVKEEKEVETLIKDDLIAYGFNRWDAIGEKKYILDY